MDRKRSLKRILAGVMALSMITGSTINDTGNYFLKMDNVAIVHAGDLAHFNPSVLSVKRHENGNVKSITIRYQWPYGNLYNAVVMTNKKIYHGNKEFSGYYGGKNCTSFDDSKKSIEWIGESGNETNTTAPIIKATEFYNVNGNDAKPHIIDKTFEFTVSELPITEATELYFYMWTKNGSNVYYPDFQLATLKIQDGEVYYGWAENPASNALPNIVATIGDKKYDTLQEALEAAADGETVKIHGNLLGNFVFDSAGKAVTLDLNGYGLMTNSGTALKVNAGKLTITDSNAESEHKFTVDGNNKLAKVDDSLTENYKTFKGGFITGGTTCGISVSGNGTELTLKSGTILGNKGTNGGGISCASGSIVNVTGGSIQNNYATNGAGIYIDNNGTSKMSGGIIQENFASSLGGGVYVGGAKAVYELSGGTIQGNKSNNGGGVACCSSSKMNMTGGVIQYNEGTGNTAGILLDNTDNFTMSGGTVQYNAGLNYGGIGTYKSTPHLSGKINITNNVINNPTTGMIIKGDDGKYSLKEGGTPCDIRQANRLTDINGKIDKGSKIGVFRSTNVFTTNFKANNEEDPAVSAFFSNDSTYAIRQNADGELMFDINLELIGEKTYAISNDEEYALFANYVNAGNDCTGLTFVLTNDIQTSEKVGVVEGKEQRKPFSGTFDGAGHRLNVDITDNSNQGTAPFCFIKNATIKNVRVTGAVNSSQHHAAGLVGFTGVHDVPGPENLIENCIVSTTVNGGDYAGGVVGHALSTKVTYDGCVFDGIINGSNANATLGVIQGWADASTSTVKNCLFVMKEGQKTNNISFVKNGTKTVTDSYKTVNVADGAALSHTIECAEDISLNLGESKKSFEYDGIKVYENAVQYNGKIYGAEGKTFKLTAKPELILVKLLVNNEKVDFDNNNLSFVMPKADAKVSPEYISVNFDTPDGLIYSGKEQKLLTVTGDLDADIKAWYAVRRSGEIPPAIENKKNRDAYSRIQAEKYDAYNGSKGDRTYGHYAPGNYSNSTWSDDGVLGWITKGDTAVYKDVVFGEDEKAQNIIFRYSSGAASQVSIWIDGKNKESGGTKLKTLTLKNTASWEVPNTVNETLDVNVTGKHDVYLVFDVAGLNVDYFAFSGAEWKEELPSAVDAGMYEIKCKLVDADNKVKYSGSFENTIAKKDLSIVKASAEKVYDGKAFDAKDFEYYVSDETKCEASEIASLLDDPKTEVKLAFTKSDDDSVTGDGKTAGSYNVNISITNPNYEAVALEKMKAVISKADLKVESPSKRTATYGQKLSEIALPEAENGKWAWAEPAETTVGNAGTNSFKAIFAPADANYNTVQKDVSVEVAKANVTITEAPSAAVIVYEQSLADSKLTGGTVMFGETPVKGTFAWKDGKVKPSVADSGKTKYAVIFTPEDNNNFNTAECEITLAVAKATPDYTEPKDLATTYGKTLEDVILPKAENGKWTWAEPAASVGNAGTNSFKAVFTPTDTNYNTVQKDVSVEVAKANATITEAPSAAVIVYEQSLTDSKLTGGTVMFGETPVKGTFAWKDGKVKPSVADSGKTKYAVIFTPEDNNNFNTAECEIILAVAKATPDYTEPKDLATTYGKTLEDVILPEAGNGKWTWAEPAASVGNAGTNSFKAVFTPTDTNYNTVQKDVPVEVAKADVTVKEAPSAAVIVYEQSLADSKLTGGTVMFGETPVKGTFAWKDGKVKPSVADSGKTKYAVIFTPEDDKNFNTAECEITLEVVKAEPEYTVPEDLKITYGKTLKEVTLPEGWTWIFDADTKLEELGDVVYNAAFTPEDTANYNTVKKDLTILVYVDKTALKKAISDTEAYTKDFDEEYHTRLFRDLNRALKNGKKVDESLTVTQAQIDTAAADLEEDLAYAKKLVNEIDHVQGLIDAIGEISYTDECKVRIDAAREAYDALLFNQQKLVKNYQVLVDAESEYEKLGIEKYRIIKVSGKAATHTESGLKTYWKQDGFNYEDDKCTKKIDDLETWIVIPAEGHNWGEWVTKVPATCTESGLAVRTCEEDGATETKVIPATGEHKYGKPVYTWSADGKSCTATVICETDKKFTVTEEVKATSAVKTEATCDKNGITTYTATFKNELFSAQTKDVEDIPATGHKFGKPEYTWSEDGKTCTATVTCENDKTHVITEKAVITGTVKTAATCDKNGVTTYTAKFENELFSAQTKDVEDIPATNHKFGKPEYTWSEDGKSCTALVICETDKKFSITEKAEVTSAMKTAATCEKNGVTTYTAKFKNELFSAQTKDVEDIAATGHKYGKPVYTWSEDGKNCTATVICETDKKFSITEKAEITSAVKTAATCEKNGVTTYTAKFKNELFSAQTKDVEDIAATGHKLGEWTVAKEVTCDEDGLEVRKCEFCDMEETRAILAEGHELGEWKVTKAATCEESGVETRYCIHDDGTFETREIKAAGHEFGEWTVSKKVTCEEDGLEIRKCVHCGKEETRVIPATGHKFSEWKTVAELTDETDGLEVRTCEHCGREEARASLATGHEFGEWVVTEEVTCEKSGVETRYCNHNDGTFETREIKAIGHKYGEWTVAKEATCEEYGLEIRKCEHCGKEETRAIPATGHKLGEWTVYREATCTDEGIEVRTCEHCDKEESRTIPATGHEYGEWTVSKEATCDRDGLEVRTCKHCGKEETRAIPATGHKFGEWVVSKVVTDEIDGYETRKCEHCGKEETRAVLAPGHELGEWEVTKAATCEENGIETRYCTHDDGTFETREIRATGHNFGDWTVTKPATCEEDGIESRFCDICGKEETRSIPATGHKYGLPVYTWSEDGKTCTATVTCENDKKHVITEEAVITSAVKTEATCDKVGVTTYTAKFENKFFSTKTKDVEDIPATGHKYGTPEYTWSEDGKTCTATVTCENDKTHVITEKAVITPAVKTEATCDKAGVTTYTAKFENKLFSAQTKDVTDIPATGEHKFDGWHVTITANAEHDGTKEHKCEVCGLTETASTSYDYHESADEVNDPANKPGEISNITDAKTNACGGTIDVDKKAIIDTFPLTTEECDQVENGKDIGLKLEVTDISENEGVKEEADKAVKETVGENGVVAAVLDVSIHKYIDGKDTGRVTQLNKVLRVYIDLPAGLYKEGRTFYVVREHNGSYEALPLTVVSETRAYFESDQYSQFYIVYTEAPVHEHEFGEWKTTQNASWLHDGYEERTCECGEKETRKVEESWTEWLVGAVGRKLKRFFS